MIIIKRHLKLITKHEKVLKILIPKQIIQRLPIVLAEEEEAGNTSENLLN